MSDYARRNAQQLADLLLQLGPDAPTLCAGWTTRDLAAHLVVRERRPDAMVGVLIPPLAGHAEHVRLAGRRSRTQIVARGAQPAVVEPGEQPADRRAGQHAWSSSSTTRTSAAAGPAGSRASWSRASSGALAGAPSSPAGWRCAGSACRSGSRGRLRRVHASATTRSSC